LLTYGIFVSDYFRFTGGTPGVGKFLKDDGTGTGVAKWDNDIGSFIPLAGTNIGAPVTGNIEVIDNIKFYAGTGGAYIQFGDISYPYIDISNFNGVNALYIDSGYAVLQHDDSVQLNINGQQPVVLSKDNSQSKAIEQSIKNLLVLR